MKSRRDFENEIVAGRIYTVPELAKVLKIGRQTIYNKISNGENLPKLFRIGSMVRFRGSDVVKFIEEQMP